MLFNRRKKSFFQKGPFQDFAMNPIGCKVKAGISFSFFLTTEKFKRSAEIHIIHQGHPKGHFCFLPKAELGGLLFPRNFFRDFLNIDPQALLV